MRIPFRRQRPAERVVLTWDNPYYPSPEMRALLQAEEDRRAAGSPPLPPRDRIIMFVGAVVALSALGYAVIPALLPLKTAPTTIVLAADARVRDAGGEVRVAQVGTTVPPGATVHTGSNGFAVLSTRGRLVTLGADTRDRVVHGARQELLGGAMYVDTRHGPQLDLGTAGSGAHIPRGSLARLAGGRTVHSIMVLAGRVRWTDRDTRPDVTVDTWHSARNGLERGTVQDATAALPGDALDVRVIPDLVAVDRRLDALAVRLDDPAVAAVVRARLQPTRTSMLATARTEPVRDRARQVALRLLADHDYNIGQTATGVAVAAAARADLLQVLGWRNTGGSWVAVAGRAHADPHQVEQRFAALLVALDPDAAAPVAGPHAGKVTTPTPAATGSRHSVPSATPTPTRTPLREPDLVDDVIGTLPAPARDTIRDLLPTPRPTITPPVLPRASGKWSRGLGV